MKKISLFSGGLKRSIVLVVVMLLTCELFSQTIVQATVKDTKTSEVLPWCSISIKGTKRGTITNSEGTFVITLNIPADTLLFSYIGYKDLMIPSSEV